MIPEELQEALARFQTACQADHRVAAAFVGGSLASGTADEYSDLDLYLITQGSEYENFFAGREAFMRQLGDPVFLEDFNGFGFDMVLFIFRNGVKGELALAKASSFGHIHHGPYRVLVDKFDLLKGVTFPIEHLPSHEQRINLEKLLKSFWRFLYLLTGELGRRRLLTAAGYLEGMRRQLLQVCRLSVDFSDIGGHPPSESFLPQQLIRELSQTYSRLEREEMVLAAQQAVSLFQRVAKPLAQAQSVQYPESLEQVVLRRFQSLIRMEAHPNTDATGEVEPQPR
jgi:predicted nucleotidyltransferase